MIRLPSHQYKTSTLTWHLICKNARVGVIRTHEGKIPGPYYEVGTVIVIGKEFELVGYLTTRKLDRESHKELYRYLRSLGYKRRKPDRAK